MQSSDNAHSDNVQVRQIGFNRMLSSRMKYVVWRAAGEYGAPLLMFIALALCAHAAFLLQFFGESFTAFTYVGGDATSQMIPAISLLEQSLLSGDIFWSWNYGLGGDVYSELSYYYSTSPFFYAMFLVKCLFGAAGADFATTQVWRLVGSVIKQTLCMMFLYRLCRQEKRTRIFAFLGAVMYGCSFWFIDNSFAFDFMTDAMLWPPLVVMAYNRFRMKNKPLCLIIVAALAVANSFYFAYMLVLFLILFALVFSLPLHGEEFVEGEALHAGEGSHAEEGLQSGKGRGESFIQKLRSPRSASPTPLPSLQVGKASHAGEASHVGKGKSGTFAVYAKRVGVLTPIMLVAFALAAVAFLPSVRAFFSADRVPQLVSTSLLPANQTLAMLPEILFLGYTPSSAMDLQTFAFPLAVLLVPFIRWCEASADVKKKTALAVIMLLLSVSPAASSLFSGMSYPSNRWLYLVIFAVAYAFPAWMETLLRQRRIRVPALAFVVIAAVLCLVTLDARWNFGNQASGYNFPAIEGVLVAHLALGVAFIAALALVQHSAGRSGKLAASAASVAHDMPVDPATSTVPAASALPSLPAAPAASAPSSPLAASVSPASKLSLAAAGVLFVAAAVLVMPFGPLCAMQGSCNHPGAQTYSSYEQLNAAFEGDAATQAAYAQLQPSNDEFYRVQDGETAINRTYDSSEARVENRSWVGGTYGTSAYNSMIPRSLNRVLKKSYAVTSTSLSASQYRGLGNRLFLENAWGIGYKLNMQVDANMPLAGYHQRTLDDGTVVWENANACGIDLWYSSVFPSSDSFDLSYGQRDALLLQTAVVEDAQEYEQEYGLPVYQGESASLENARYIDFGSLEVQYENCTFEGTAQEGTLNAGGNSFVTIDLPLLENGTYLLSFGTQNPNAWGCSFFVNGAEYYLSAANGRWTYDQTTFCISVPGDAKTLRIELPWGYFSVWDCSLEAVSYDNLAEWTQNVNTVNLENLEVEGSTVSGNVHVDEAGILAINAPYSSGWKCTIDGQQVDVMQIGEFFPGVVVQPGDHHIEFHYVNKAFVVGAVVSVLAVVALAVGSLLRSRFRRKVRDGRSSH